MAVSYTYNTTLSNVMSIFRTTSSGTIFSADLSASGTFDYFTDSAAVNDAIYFSWNGATLSDIVLNVGTTISGTDITLVWEYYKGGTGWTAIHNLKDDTVGLTVLGTNRVRFPHQWMHNYVTVNAVDSRLWIRCRISTLTTITEGGSNTGVRVQCGDGSVNVIGGTELATGSFGGIMIYMNTNYSYVTCTNPAPGTYDFRQVSVKMNSYLRSNWENIWTGNNNTNGGFLNVWDYFLSGTLYGSKAFNGSTVVVYGTINTSVLTFGSNCKIYGCVFRGADYKQFGYFSTGSGDVQYCDFVGSFTLQGSSLKNCRISTGFVICGGPPTLFIGNSVVFSSVNMMYCYTSSWSLKDFDFQFMGTTPSKLCYGYQSSGRYNQVWELVNPGTKILPIGTSGNITTPITYSSGYLDLTSCKFYDASSGTYTDYTIQSNNDTTEDVPLTGDIGDCYLFGSPTANGQVSTMSFRFELPNQSNDYVYIWEKYTSGIWGAVDSSWFIDQTENFTKSGTVFLWDSPSYAALDGVTAYWIRVRIINKGLNIPIVNRIRKHNLSCASRWTIQEKYTLDLQVVDYDGVNIDGVTVTMTDSYGDTVFITTTDANGQINQQQFFSKKWWFDPLNATVYPFASEKIYGNMTLNISKDGYETYENKGISCSDKLTLFLKLNYTKKIRQTVDGKVYLANTPELGSSSYLLVI